MRVLVANVKLFYQNSEIWYLYAIFGVIACGFLGILHYVDDPAETLAALIFGVLIIGFFVGVMQGRIALWSASHCLPGHRVTFRRVVLAIGLAVAPVGSLLFVGLHGEQLVSSGRLVSVLFSTLSVSWAIYLLGATGGASAVGRWVAGTLVVGSIAANYGLSRVSSPSLYSMLMEAMAVHPAIVSVSGAVCAGVIWVQVRRLRLMPAEYEDFEGDDPVRGEDSRLGRLFMRKTAQCRPLDRWKYLWGTLYVTPLVESRLSVLIWLVLGIVLLCYVPLFGPMVFLVVCFGPISDVELPVHARLLPVAGRYERYFSTMALVAALWGVSLLLGVGMIVGTSILACVAPDITVGRFASRPDPGDPRFLWAPLAITPVVALWRALWIFYRENVLAQAILVMAGFSGVLFAAAIIAVLRTGYVAAISAFAWMLLAFVVRRLALRHDLVWERREV